MYRVSETKDWRELIGECGATSEKDAKGWAKLEKARGVQRYPVWYISNVREAQKQRQDTITLIKSLSANLSIN